MSKTLTGLGEFQLHDLIRQAVSMTHSAEGLVDDCAVLAQPGGSWLLLNVDRLPSCPFRLAPRLLVAQALSDVICMGGTPLGLMPALGLSRDMAASDLLWFMQEVAQEAGRYGALVLGGDTKEAEAFGAVTCAVGTSTLPPTTRGGAKPGDVVLVTSTQGQRWGERWLSYLSPDRSQAEEQRANIQLPQAESKAAHEMGGVTSATDLSDGIGAACQLMSAASNVTFVLDFSALEELVDVALLPELRALGLPIGFLALSPGYMWENCFTVSRKDVERTVAAVAAVGGRLSVVGRVEAGRAEARFSDAPRAWLRLASDEKFQNNPAGNQPNAWLSLARALLIEAGKP